VMDPRPARSVGVTMRAAAVLLTLVLLAGCGGDDEQAGGAAPARLAEPITFEVVGGDAFRDDELTVRPDGTASVRTRAGEATAELTSEELSALERESARLASAEDALTKPPVPDALWYRLSYGGRQVETDDPAMPEALRPLIGNLVGLVDRYGPK
jgi:hypothetical protein